jgi:hypothetical protein
MSKYPRLTEMGVQHPEHIASYSISSVDYTDNLRITYIRPKGSLLPVSRSYRFPRTQRTAVLGPESDKGKVVMESAPAFREAVKELQALLSSRETTHGVAAGLLEEIEALEQELAERVACLKRLAGQLKPD